MALLVDCTQNINWEDEQEDYDDILKEDEVKSHRVLVGKIIPQCIINKQSIREIIMHSWRFIDSLEVIDLSNNAFLFTFSHLIVWEKIFNDGSWNVRGQMLILKPWSPSLTIGEIYLCSTPMWIQIHELPLFKMTEISVKNMTQLMQYPKKRKR